MSPNAVPLLFLTSHSVMLHAPCVSCCDLTVCLVSFSSSLLTLFDLADLETSVDSRCTTDSADSAFIGRRY